MVKKKRKRESFSSAELKELTYIRKLIMLQLIRDGVDSEEIASALGIDSSTVRHMISFRKIERKGK